MTGVVMTTTMDSTSTEALETSSVIPSSPLMVSPTPTTLTSISINDLSIAPPITFDTFTNATSSTNSFNATGLMMESEGDFDPSLTDLQTLMITGASTLLILVVILAIGFSIRMVWRKVRRRQHGPDDESGGGTVARDSSSEPLAGSRLTDEIKTSTSHFSVTPYGGTGDGNESGMANQGNTMHPSKTNGSIITMTLKNNHLIVETEEHGTPGIGPCTKTTRTTFSAAAAAGGAGVGSGGPNDQHVFVVEVQQVSTPVATATNHNALTNTSPSTSQEKVQVHPPPRESDKESVVSDISPAPTLSDNPRAGVVSSCTGLSQSDLSSCGSESGSGVGGYGYGTQCAYDHGPYGYQRYHGYDVEEGPFPTTTAVIIGSVTTTTVSGAASDDEALLLEEQRRLGNGNVAVEPVSS